MAEAELRRLKDSQLEFPHAPNHRSTLNPSHTNGGMALQRQTQQQNVHYHQHHISRASPSISHSSVSSKGKMSQSMMGASVNDHSEGSSVIHPTPMFQRLVSDGVQELKAYARIIETQNRRLSELEVVHRDLEGRLEVQSNRRLELEKTLEDREHLWTEQIAEIKKERDYWEELVNVERKKNAKLHDQILRKDQDIHRMLSRKYDGAVTSSIRNARVPSSKSISISGSNDHFNSSLSPGNNPANHKSPNDFLTGGGSSEHMTELHANQVLKHFFGLK